MPPLIMLSKTRCPIGSKNAVFNLLIKGGPAPEKCYARVWPGHRVRYAVLIMFAIVIVKISIPHTGEKSNKCNHCDVT